MKKLLLSRKMRIFSLTVWIAMFAFAFILGTYLVISFSLAVFG